MQKSSKVNRKALFWSKGIRFEWRALRVYWMTLVCLNFACGSVDSVKTCREWCHAIALRLPSVPIGVKSMKQLMGYRK